MLLGELGLELEDLCFIESGLIIEKVLIRLEVASELHLSKFNLIV